MNLDQLKQVVNAREGIDVSPHYAAYWQSTGSDDVAGFARYLRDQGVIGPDLLKQLHEQEQVEVTLLMNPGAAGSHLKGANMPIEGPAEEDEDPPRYEMLGTLGEGAMGAVHLARDIVLRRKVALKSILPQMQQHQEVFSRFLGEMQITSQLDHPYIVPIYGLEVTEDGSVAYAMKLVSGKEFGDLLEEAKAAMKRGETLAGHLTLEGRLDYFLKVCDAMAFAHARGIVHRDLKPANIMIGSHNEVYVMDWGIARPIGSGGVAADKGLELLDVDGDSAGTDRTRMGQVLGTPIYMSPEQASGRNAELDGRSDLYTLGLILQETITLERAIGGTTMQEVLTNAKQGRREPLRRQSMGSAPRELEAIIAKATSLRPDDRYADVTAFADDIRRYLRNEAVVAQPDGPLQAMARWISKHRVESLAIMLSLLLIGAGATIGVLVHSSMRADAQHRHALGVSEMRARSSAQAQMLDRELQRYESALAKLVGAAQTTLSHSEPPEEATVHYVDGFKPADLGHSRHYGKAISMEHPAVMLSPGVSGESVEAELGSLDWLRPMWREAVLESLGVSVHQISPAAQRQILAETGVPVSRAYLTLATGATLSYPGMAGDKPSTDPRKAPSYELALKKLGVQWRGPYEGAHGQELAASAAVYDEKHALRGVAGFEINVARLFEKVNLGDVGYVDTTLLVTRDGTVVARSGEGGDAVGSKLSFPEIVAAIAEGKGGHLEREGQLITFTPLRTLPWYLVAIAEVEKVVEREEITESPVVPWAGGELPPPVPVASPAPASPAPPPPAPTATATATTEPEEEAPAPSAAPTVLPGPMPTAPWGQSKPNPPPDPEPEPKSPPPDPEPAQPPPPPMPKNPFDRWEDKKK